MTQVRYLGPSASLDLPDGQTVERDGTVDLDKALADELVARSDFEAVKAKTSTTKTKPDIPAEED